MAEIHLEWSDIWILRALYVISPNGGQMDLEGLIATGDAINHAILTFEEVNNGIYRLLKAHLLTNEKGDFQFTEIAKALFDRFSGQGWLKQMSLIRKALGVPDWSSDYDPNLLISPEVFVLKNQFDQALLSYRSRYR